MPNHKYTVQEHVTIVKLFYKGLSLRKIRDSFLVLYPDRPTPSSELIRKTVKRFEKNGCFDPSHSKVIQPSKRVPDDVKIQVCALSEVEGIPLSQISEMVGISKASAHRIIGEERKACKLRATKQRAIDKRKSNDERNTKDANENNCLTDKTNPNLAVNSTKADIEISKIDICGMKKETT